MLDKLHRFWGALLSQESPQSQRELESLPLKAVCAGTGMV